MNRIHSFIVTSTLLGCILLAIVCLSLTTGITPVMGAANQSEAIFTPALSASSEGISPEPESLSNTAPVDNLSCRVSERYPESIRQWCGIITQQANQYNLSPDLIAALIWQESGGDPLAYSRSGAVGLMQVMPSDGLAASFQCVNGPCFADRPTIAELQDPIFNVEYGTRFLAGLQTSKGSLREALKAYGPANVGYSYADKVLGLYQSYGEE